MKLRVLLAAAIASLVSVSALAYDGIVEKKVFTLPSYATVGGKNIPYTRVGYETYGTLNAAKDNAILITHFYSGNSHAAGKYKADDKVPGYWDNIIGAGKPIDTNKFFVLAVDSLVNLNVKDGYTVTTGPATVNPETGKPWGMSFPVVTIRDFVNVQKLLVDSMGIKKLHAVIGASMGSFQAYEWASAYPDMVARVVPVIPNGEADAFTLGWIDLWAEPIRLDPNWNKGDYYGKAEPMAGLTAALKIVTLHARHPQWADTIGRKWADDKKDPGQSLDNRFAMETWLEQAAAARAAVADANHFLYLARANQLFVTGHKGSLEEGFKAIKAKILLLPSSNDLLLTTDKARKDRDQLKALGKNVDYAEIDGPLGHLNGVAFMPKVGDKLAKFLAE